MRSLLAAAAVALAAGVAGCAGASSVQQAAIGSDPPALAPASTSTTASTTSTTSSTTAAPRVPAAARRPPYRIRERTITFVDGSRHVRIPGEGVVPRRLVTVIRYPDAPGAGPFPLIIFGHGFAVTPATYWRLLTAWAHAGFVVAAPVFPLENAHAPGGPDESDLVNQPGDMSFLITRLTARDGPLHGIVNTRQVAVTGQSDGGETALAVAYDRAFQDRRVHAAVILSGAQIPGLAELRRGPPLLATQGTADTVNRPYFTQAFFNVAGRPKFLLWLDGAPHLPPYTGEQPQLSIVERVTIAFLDRYLENRRPALAQMRRAANRPGVAQLVSEP